MARMAIHRRRSFIPHPHAGKGSHGVLIRLSAGYPPAVGRFHTRYAPVRRSPPGIATRAAPRLACVRPAASVHPEPGSNSSLYSILNVNIVFFQRRLAGARLPLLNEQ